MTETFTDENGILVTEIYRPSASSSQQLLHDDTNGENLKNELTKFIDTDKFKKYAKEFYADIVDCVSSIEYKPSIDNLTEDELIDDKKLFQNLKVSFAESVLNECKKFEERW